MDLRRALCTRRIGGLPVKRKPKAGGALPCAGTIRRFYTFPFRGNVYFSQTHPIPTGYRPGVERGSLYKDVWRRFWPELQDVYASRFQSKYGPLRRRKIHEVERLLACGRFSNGFVRHECTGCGTVLVVPFSCKSRLCVSCYRKKLFSWSLNLSKILEPSFGHSHITFTMPGRLGNLLLKRHFDASSLAKIAARVHSRFLQADQNFSGDWMPGIREG